MYQKATRRLGLTVLLMALAMIVVPVAKSVRPSPAAVPPAEIGSWRSSGPRVGRALTLAVSPNFADDGFAFSGEWLTSFRSTEMGLGIVRSTDGGQTWSVSDAGTGTVDYSSAVHDFSFSPAFSSDRTVFAATWGGLFKSTDGGSTWQWLEGAYSAPPGTSTSIAVAPDYTSSDLVLAGDWGGLLLSQDDGETWSRRNGIGASADIIFSPGFAGDSTAFSAGGGAIYRTTDAALTWTPVISSSVSALAISPDFGNDGTVFAGGDLFLRSADGGTTWISRTISTDVRRVNALAVSPAFPDEPSLYAGTTQGLYYSQDGGLSWQAVSAYAGQSIQSLAISPQWPEHRVLLVGTDEGVYRLLSDDPHSRNVRSLTSGFAVGSASPLAWSASENLLLTATSNHGLYGSGDGGQSWQPMGLQAGYGYYSFSDVGISPQYGSDETLFAAWSSGTGIGGSVYRSTDGGDSWDAVYSTDYVGDMALSPHYGSDQVIFACSAEKGLMRSGDGGDTWETVGTWPGWLRRGTVLQVALPPDYPGDSTVMVGGARGFWYLPPGADIWQPAASGLTDVHYVSSLKISPAFTSDQTLLAVAYWRESTTALREGLFRSTNGGRDWTLSSNGLPDAALADLALADVAFSPNFAEDQVAYLSTATGDLYRSDDGGLSWIRAGTAPGAPALHELVVQSPGRVFVASEEGVWRYSTLLYDIVANGGFEANSGWTFPPTMQTAAYSEAQAYEGHRSARVGVVESQNSASYSSVYQDLALPEGVHEATLYFYLYPRADETALGSQQTIWPPDEARASAAFDAQYVLVLDPQNNNILETLVWQASDARRWEAHTFDLSAYAGEDIRLLFGVYNDGAGGSTGMYVDAVALQIMYPPASVVRLPLITR